MKRAFVFTIKALLDDVWLVMAFSNLARMAFIAAAVLNSLVLTGILSEDDR